MPNTLTDQIYIEIDHGNDVHVFNDFRSYSINFNRFLLTPAFTIILNDTGQDASGIGVGDVINIHLIAKEEMDTSFWGSGGATLSVLGTKAPSPIVPWEPKKAYDHVIFVGIIERIDQRYTKKSNEITLTGRDVACQLVDQFFDTTEIFTTVSVSTEVQSTFKKWFNKYSPILDKSGQRITLLSINLDVLEANPPITILKDFHVDIGNKVWDKMLELMKATNLVYLYSSFTTTLFIYPRTVNPFRYYDDYVGPNTHHLISLNGDPGGANNILECNYKEDISGRYSTMFWAGDVGVGTTLVDESMPISSKNKTSTYGEIYQEKVFEAIARDDQANEKIQGTQIEYTLANHTLNGYPFTVFDSIQLDDDILGFRNVGLTVYDVTYSMSIDSGVRTKLIIGPYGPTDETWAPPAMRKVIADDYNEVKTKGSVPTINPAQPKKPVME